MAIIYFGSPELAVPPLLALIESGEEVAAVVTRPDARRGRGGRMSPSAVKAMALKHGVKSLEPRSMGDAAFLNELRSYKPEFLVVVAYGKLLPPEVLELPGKAAVNLHASLLPKYRGAAPINWAVINGEGETGITTMLMSEGLDEGDILISEQMMIEHDDTAESLGRKMAEAGGPMLVKTLAGLRGGSITPVPQEGESSYARMLGKLDGAIDWQMPANVISNRVRGMYPWPGAFCYINDKKLKVLGARSVDLPRSNMRPGEVLASDEKLVLATGSGCVELTEVQPEGKRPMPAGDFLRGHGIKVGDIFE